MLLDRKLCPITIFLSPLNEYVVDIGIQFLAIINVTLSKNNKRAQPL